MSNSLHPSLSERQRWSKVPPATVARCILWSSQLSDAIEVLALLEVTECETTGPSRIDLADVAHSGNSNSILGTAKRHLRNHLSTILGAIFGQLGDHDADLKWPVAANKIIDDWKGPMSAHAFKLGCDEAFLCQLTKELKDNRNQLVAHRSGKDAAMDVDPDGSIVFRSDVRELRSDEIVSLKFFLRSCRDFVEHAALRDGKPAFPFQQAEGRYESAAGQWSYSTTEVWRVLVASRSL